jgi:hypothetical protein
LNSFVTTTRNELSLDITKMPKKHFFPKQ